MRNVLTPPVYSQHRQLFEGFYHDDENTARYISLGAQIELVREELSAAARTPQELSELYHQKYKWLTDYSGTQVAEIEKNPLDDKTAFHRTKLFNAILEPLVCIPAVQKFKPHHSYALRKKLVATDGIYGAIAGVIEDALGSAHATYKLERGDLIGFINDATAVALPNRDQDPNRISLPALPHQDLMRGIDTITYGAVRGHHLPVRESQVKSDERLHADRKSKIQLIGGIALGNSRLSPHWRKPLFLHTAHAIVNEVNAIASAREERTLDAIASGLNAALRTGNNFVYHEPRTVCA